MIQVNNNTQRRPVKDPAGEAKRRVGAVHQSQIGFTASNRIAGRQRWPNVKNQIKQGSPFATRLWSLCPQGSAEHARQVVSKNRPGRDQLDWAPISSPQLGSSTKESFRGLNHSAKLLNQAQPS